MYLPTYNRFNVLIPQSSYYKGGYTEYSFCWRAKFIIIFIHKTTDQQLIKNT